eukprot:scaffold128272_cov63-Phaeocystis_antarctica.AAC.1
MAGSAIGLVEKKVLEPRWMRYSVRSAPAAMPVTWPSRSGRVASAKAFLKAKRGGLSPSEAQLTWLGL